MTRKVLFLLIILSLPISWAQEPINGGNVGVTAFYPVLSPEQVVIDTASTHDVLVLGTAYARKGYPSLIKTTNPNAKVLVYQSWVNAGLGNNLTFHGTVIPDWDEINQHEDWFYHDENGLRICIYSTINKTYCDPARCVAGEQNGKYCNCRFGMDLGNVEYQQWAANRLYNIVNATNEWGGSDPYYNNPTGFDGIMMDNTMVDWPYRSEKVATTWSSATPVYADGHLQTAADWRRDQKAFLAALKTALGSKLLIFNGCAASVSDPMLKSTSVSYLESSDGCTMENWVVNGVNESATPKTNLDYRTDLELFQNVHSLGKWSMPLIGQGMHTSAVNHYGIASVYLFGGSIKSMTNFWRGSADSAMEGTFEEDMVDVKVDLGNPLGPATLIGPNFWNRNFEGGRVLVNASGGFQAVMFDQMMMLQNGTIQDYVNLAPATAAFVFPAPPGHEPPAPRKYFVRPDAGIDRRHDGATNYPATAYSNLGHAFRTARPGDQILITPGTYREFRTSNYSYPIAHGKALVIPTVNCDCTHDSTAITCDAAPTGFQVGDFVHCAEGYGFKDTEVTAIDNTTITLAEGYRGESTDVGSPSGRVLSAARYLKISGTGKERTDVVFSAWYDPPGVIPWTKVSDSAFRDSSIDIDGDGDLDPITHCTYKYTYASFPKLGAGRDLADKFGKPIWTSDNTMIRYKTDPRDIDDYGNRTWPAPHLRNEGLFYRVWPNQCPCGMESIQDAVDKVPRSYGYGDEDADGTYDSLYWHGANCENPSTIELQAGSSSTYQQLLGLDGDYIILENITFDQASTIDIDEPPNNVALNIGFPISAQAYQNGTAYSHTSNIRLSNLLIINGKISFYFAINTHNFLLEHSRFLGGTITGDIYFPEDGVFSGFKIKDVEFSNNTGPALNFSNLSGPSTADPVIFDGLHIGQGYIPAYATGDYLNGFFCGANGSNIDCKQQRWKTTRDQWVSGGSGIMVGSPTSESAISNIVIQNSVFDFLGGDAIGVYGSSANISIRNNIFGVNNEQIRIGFGNISGHSWTARVANNIFLCTSGYRNCSGAINSYGDPRGLSSDFNVFLYPRSDYTMVSRPAGVSTLFSPALWTGTLHYTWEDARQNGFEEHSKVICAQHCGCEASPDCTTNGNSCCHDGTAAADYVNLNPTAALMLPADKGYTDQGIKISPVETDYQYQVRLESDNTKARYMVNLGRRWTRIEDLNWMTDGTGVNYWPLPTFWGINNGNNSECPTNDFFDNSRTDGYCDIGAFEHSSDPAAAPKFRTSTKIRVGNVNINSAVVH